MKLCKEYLKKCLDTAGALISHLSCVCHFLAYDPFAISCVGRRNNMHSDGRVRWTLLPLEPKCTDLPQQCLYQLRRTQRERTALECRNKNVWFMRRTALLLHWQQLFRLLSDDCSDHCQPHLPNMLRGELAEAKVDWEQVWLLLWLLLGWRWLCLNVSGWCFEDVRRHLLLLYRIPLLQPIK